MPAENDAAVGYAQLDEKGRVSLGKPLRQALGLRAGSTVAYVQVGEILMLIPQDEHLESTMSAAQRAFERAGLTVEEILDALPAARAETILEHYGIDTLKRLGYADPASDPDILFLDTGVLMHEDAGREQRKML